MEKSARSGSTRCLKNGEWNLFWKQWKDAYFWDQTQHSCPLHEKLREEHFELTPSSRMRNRLAEDVLDKKMLFLMKVSKSWDFSIFLQCFTCFPLEGQIFSRGTKLIISITLPAPYAKTNIKYYLSIKEHSTYTIIVLENENRRF